MVLVAGFAVVGQSQAEAGLFNRDKCCKPAKKCRTPRRSRDECCEPVSSCQEPVSCCQEVASCAPAPCVEATPACGGCEAAIAAPACGGCAQTACCPSRREQRKARRNDCCIQTCGCETQGCGSCSASISGCSSCGGGQVIQGAVVEGCSNCGDAPVEAPAPAIEAAPEAPEGDSTT